MAESSRGNDTNVNEDSDTESFVDALEDLHTQAEKPVEFLPAEEVSDELMNSTESSSTQSDDTPVAGAAEASEASRSATSRMEDMHIHGMHSDEDAKRREQTFDDLIQEATKSEMATGSGDTENPEPSDVIAESNSEDEGDMSERKETEAAMTEDEKEAKKEEAQAKKLEGNERFKSDNYQGALDAYTDALMLCPLNYTKERSIMYSNRAACKYKLERYDSAVQDCTKALELNPVYLKALLRRAELYEKIDKLDEALTDYTKALEMDRTLVKARIACQTLPDRIKERNEKLKEEMLDKLKDLGNLILRPFGLSTNNFKLQQDPATGSYSVQFQQSQPPDPSNGK